MRTFFTTACLMGLMMWSGCKKNEVFNEGLRIEIADRTVISGQDIDFYDFSTHMIYLKNGKKALKDITSGSFTVYANDHEIYSGVIQPGYSSYLSAGAVIKTMPSFYSDYVLPIEFTGISGTGGSVNPDPRGDSRIRQVLEKYGQYRAGLACEIVSIDVQPQGGVILELQLTNQDTEDLYYLDPVKMGTGLFHYFTNGLYFRNARNDTFKPRININQPQGDWRMDWLSVIKSNERRQITIRYPDFDAVPPGTYDINFVFPGLHQVNNDLLRQGNGRIWLGELAINQKTEVR